MAEDGVGVLAVAEIREGRPASITAEVLGAGRALADGLGISLGALVLGGEVRSLAEEMAALGADRVYVMEDARLAQYHGEVYTAALAAAVRAAAPSIILMGHTLMGRDLAPRLAFRLGAGLVTDCVGLAVEGGELRAAKPVYGGKLVATVAWEGHGPHLATLRPKTVEPAAPRPGRAAAVTSLDPPGDLEASLRLRVLERRRLAAQGPRIEDAPVVVAGGRGMGGKENFKYLEELAALLGGAVGGSRAATDAGWTSSAQQVGLTGKVVKPRLYIAVGVSGAMQHMAGCQGARTLVAINTDPRAPIFQYAHFGVVGDWAKVLPSFTAKCRELLA